MLQRLQNTVISKKQKISKKMMFYEEFKLDFIKAKGEAD